MGKTTLTAPRRPRGCWPPGPDDRPGPQGQLALSFAAAGVRRRPDVYAQFLSDRPLLELVQQPVADHPLHLITGHPETEKVETELVRGDDPFWVDVIRRRMHGPDDAWDYVLFDCHPSFSAVNRTALYYVDEIWLPVRLDAYSLDSYMRLEERLVKLRKSAAMITNVIPTHFDLGGRRGETLWTHAPSAAATHDLTALVDHIMRQEKGS